MSRLIYRYFLPFFVWVIYRSLSITWRVEVIESPSFVNFLQKKSPVILAHWHGDELFLMSLIGRYRVATIASTSLDGDMITRLIHLFGGVTSRGSSTRGGVTALKGLIRLVRAGRNSSFAVDGPKGPLHSIKPGVFELSRLISAPIFPAGVSCSSAWRFPKSWNKTYLPKPFAKILLNWGESIGPLSREQDARDEKLAKQLKDALHYSAEVAEKKNFASGS